MRHLAKDYGVSDRAIAKLCVRKQVPAPPRGYWAQKSAGQKVVRPPLPAFVEKEKPKPESPEPEVKKPAKRKPISPIHGKIEKRRLNKYSGNFDADS
jgi:hypothetical protein